MQNIPGIALEKASDQITTVKIASVNRNDKNSLFDDLFNEHANLVESELALSPVSSQEKMLNTAPLTDEVHEDQVNAAGTKVLVKEEVNPAAEVEEERDLDTPMTSEEFNEVKEDLKEYGMSDEEIAELEERVESEEGLTWGQFTAAIANQMAEMRKVEMTDGQKEKLTGFFSKFGFSDKESATLISQLENGQFKKVMTALKEKLEAMPEGKPMLFEKGEVEAFTAVLSFSKEFTAKVKEAFSNNMLPKDVKEAFSLIRQEMANMDKKDQQLVRAVGKVFAKAMGETASQSSAARQIEEAIDLKPRVAETLDELKAEAKKEAKVETKADAQAKTDAKAVAREETKENFKQAVTERKESLPENQARKGAETPLPEKAEAKTDTKADPKADTRTEAKAEVKPDSGDLKQDSGDVHQDSEQENQWNNFVSKVQNDGAQTTAKAEAKAEVLDASLKSGLAEAGAKSTTPAWEKVSAPKVMQQVETALFKTLSNGGKQLTLQLTPENLGKLNVMLQVNGKEVSAQIRAENADAARIISDNIDIIKTALENQGLKVDKLDVQTGLANNQDSKNWFGQNQHNMARDREVMTAMRNHLKNMRGGNGEVAHDLQSIREQAINAEHGLHIIA